MASPVDFGRHAEDYAAYRPGFPESFYDRVDRRVTIADRLILDLATGPGTIALALAARGGTVFGLDASPAQVRAARRLAADRGLAGRVVFVVARAEATGMAPDRFDLVTAGHCWHWFDGQAALAEIRRVLRPEGVLLIAYHSYLVDRSPVAKDTEELVLRFNPSWRMAGASGTFPDIPGELESAGFELVDRFSYDHDVEFSHERWRGRMRTCNGVGSGGLGADEVARFDESLAGMLTDGYPDPFVVTHRVWCALARVGR